MSNEIINIMGQAQKLENFRCRRGGAPQVQIKSLEEKFKITLPESYKTFLEQYGFCLWCGDNVKGLIPLDEDYEYYEEDDVIRASEYYRKRYDNKDEYQSVPQHGLVINSYDGGGYYFLFSQESERAGEVGLFLTETYGQEESKFNTFTDFLSFLVTGTPDPELVDVDYDEIMDIIED
ncbi:SMI1/KNR4 family protein [Pseudoalteromonas sp. SWXJZ94C]|uniref:SMI1/KNR4 family protein n=1 Tax=Pseudoalteromonas sp. SWXJZ94C TaxID=2792065 RepID=UPI0018CD704B|nr:SMI1/KNR4 family protein [Pseudoalteromonas sp. SWXJZ94C]MBH0055580.1 SMI1/KNR4 family protein [Pseudoalteromonas sp. SWXJZ94C]